MQKKIRVNVTAQKSPLKSLEFATLKVKDAVCDRFRDKLGSRPDVDRAAPDVRIHAFLEEAKGILYLDTSGEALFKRGWRMDIAEAPIRENLAAGIIMLSGWKFDQPLLDPMCGGGTLLSEAAAMARGRAPGAKRSFGFEKLSVFDSKLWEKIRNERTRPAGRAAALRQRHRSRGAAGGAPQPRRRGRRALGEAGAEPTSSSAPRPRPPGVMVANPPYGERIGSADELAALYPKLGDALKKNFAGWNCFFFTADLRLAKLIRLQPSRRTPLWNGSLECRLYEFRIVSGSNRA